MFILSRSTYQFHLCTVGGELMVTKPGTGGFIFC